MRHQKDNHTASVHHAPQTSGNSARRKAYEKDNTNGQNEAACALIIKRTEKLAAAAHAVTSFLSDSDALKWRLRERSLDLLSDIIEAGGLAYAIERRQGIDRARGKSEEVLSLFAIGRASGAISEMNARVLEEEYQKLQDDMHEWRPEEEMSDFLTALLSEDHISARRVGLPAGAEDALLRAGAPYKGQKDKRTTNDRYNNGGGRAYVKDKTDNNNGGGVHNGHKARQEEKQKRRARIMRLAREKGYVSVRDVAAVVSDCSEKTLQRELLALVREGALEKRGEKRWSRYVLK